MLVRDVPPVGVDKRPLEASTGELVMASSVGASVEVERVGTSPREEMRCRARVTADLDRLWALRKGKARQWRVLREVVEVV